MSVYIFGNINRFHLPSQSGTILLHLASPHSWQAADPTPSIYILFAEKYYLPKNIICPERLFAQNYYLP